MYVSEQLEKNLADETEVAAKKAEIEAATAGMWCLYVEFRASLNLNSLQSGKSARRRSLLLRPR